MTDYTQVLIGRHFVTKSRNICKVVRLDNNAIRLHYENEPTIEDMKEAKEWIESIIGDCDITENIGKKTEAESLAKWKRDTKK